MLDWVDVEKAVELPGLRLVLTAGVPGPWGESAKGMFHAKKIPFARVRQDAGLPNDALERWTGQRNAPVAVWEDERGRAGWTEIVLLAERIAPDPPLVPASAADRALMFGLCHEICSEDGWGWNRRLMLLHPLLANLPEDPPDALAVPIELGRRYGYRPEAGEAAAGRAAAILELLSRRLLEQKGRGSRFFVGDALSALDVHWAAFAALLQPLPEELCPMQPFMRQSYTVADESVLAAADPILLEHRDFVYQEFLELPVET